MEKTLGGQRLGSGNKMKVHLHNYERSTHDLGYLWRSTMSAGTLVPFLRELALPGDTFDIDLDTEVRTHPTVGPLFGSYKVQLDVFLAPLRLYQGFLLNDKLGIGMNMASVKLPMMEIDADEIDESDPDNSQINPSSILAYLGIRGLGRKRAADPALKRYFNAVPFLIYWDIYKNYYANKQEEIGAVIHNEGVTSTTVDTLYIKSGATTYTIAVGVNAAQNVSFETTDNPSVIVESSNQEPDPSLIMIHTLTGTQPLSAVFTNFNWDPILQELRSNTPVITGGIWAITGYNIGSGTTPLDIEPKVATFPLENIDKMRENIQRNVNVTSAYEVNYLSDEPYGWVLRKYGTTWAKMQSQEGLALKTYQSDLFNNWISTDWIDGNTGINEITAIDTTSGSFNIDTLMLARKVYDMMMRIAVSGGSYDDWLDAVYSTERHRRVTTPMYMGGLIKELVFQEVVSNAEAGGTDGQPLGTLAGKGVMGKKHKGGKIRISVDEPSYIMGIISLTPRIDYSQGNKWDVNLKTLDDLHKPALDEIGFQDLITDQMAFWDTETGNLSQTPTFKSAGKQPAWINYMTNTNVVLGNFAIESNEMFMTLNRKYEYDANIGIKDLTTYIDPVKFNHIFAQTSRDAQNFWTQISIDITARRKMSAKIMPNL